MYLNNNITKRNGHRNYVGDVNAEAQKIMFSLSNGKYLYTYPANSDGNANAKDLNPGIDWGDDFIDICNTYALIAPSWFYIEPTTPAPFSIKVTKEIISGAGPRRSCAKEREQGKRWICTNPSS